MAYTKTSWVDEVLDGAERFEILKDAGGAVDAFADLADCRIQLETTVTTSGTPLTAANLNKLEDAMETIHADSAITAGRIASGAVTNAKLGSNAVTSAKISNSSVTPAKTSFFDTASSSSEIYFGSVSSAGNSVRLPSGWSCERISTGAYRVTHNLGTSSYILMITPHDEPSEIITKASSYFNVQLYLASYLTDTGFDFILIRY